MLQLSSLGPRNTPQYGWIFRCRRNESVDEAWDVKGNLGKVPWWGPEISGWNQSEAWYL